jgi:hypothetical protein
MGAVFPPTKKPAEGHRQAPASQLTPTPGAKKPAATIYRKISTKSIDKVANKNIVEMAGG